MARLKKPRLTYGSATDQPRDFDAIVIDAYGMMVGDYAEGNREAWRALE